MDIKHFKKFFETAELSDFISESDLDDYLLATSDKYTTKTYKGKYFIKLILEKLYKGIRINNPIMKNV